jgi:hypothetical protein
LSNHALAARRKAEIAHQKVAAELAEIANRGS